MVVSETVSPKCSASPARQMPGAAAHHLGSSCGARRCTHEGRAAARSNLIFRAKRRSGRMSFSSR